MDLSFIDDVTVILLLVISFVQDTQLDWILRHAGREYTTLPTVPFIHFYNTPCGCCFCLSGYHIPITYILVQSVSVASTITLRNLKAQIRILLRFKWCGSASLLPIAWLNTFSVSDHSTLYDECFRYLSKNMKGVQKKNIPAIYGKKRGSGKA